MKKIICGMLATVCFTAFATAVVTENNVSAAPITDKNETLETISHILDKNPIATPDSLPTLNNNNTYTLTVNGVSDNSVFKELLNKYIEEKTTPMYEKVLDYAKTFIGTPYVYGGSSPSGFDCSGYVMYVLKHFGIEMPRTSYDQMNIGQPVSLENIQPGDVLFFRGGGHVGFYVGDGNYIHSPRTGKTVSIEPLTRDIYCARRVF